MLDTVFVYLLFPLLLTLAELGDLEVLKSHFLLLDLSPNFLAPLELLNLKDVVCEDFILQIFLEHHLLLGGFFLRQLGECCSFIFPLYFPHSL